MWDYTEKVMEYFQNPRNQGTITDTQEGEKVVTGEVGSIACGDALRLHLKIDEATQTITDARFQTFGCASAIASSEALTELLIGKKVEEAMQLTNRQIADYLGGLPEEKMHCSVMGQEALEAAIHTYKGIPIETHEEDDGRLVCSCFGISEPRIRRIILENNLDTAEQVTNYVKAGGGCGSCLADIDDILIEVSEARISGMSSSPVYQTASATATLTAPKVLTNLQKITLIQQVLTEQIQPILAKDGGNVELFDVEGDIVKVILQGACSSCASSTETLKIAIEGTLRQLVSPNIIVQSV
ncbi:Fe-S cluster assembly protein NifU [Limnoraphis robusta]|uniref:Nitrogen fixation protein NifU n=2 Tax=Limnoraphis robusta TaxID=1118279 RepID=A0A0F5YLJ5_9CYAN|nr:Fe-S cluster assembly protein NifU [Limnoraphis robusta]MCG5061628.1 Fe-S cluster assembly protein NifU [Limnoraphis sp. WC205]KKD39789.1 nitrogen fixation protein NifU [Limnoraphis robusta CS-951]MEA5495719.1 Fe-S cluster assembly protein NifU [Limnoraphis robusta BA-68 BA1]MEA5521013.1 Fe-S cluster assembly protein NifU [Limnoraphis robusta CCNP1315]MEA5543542.1 Fe-S cluster assembly protein NifU [Limnoraphis robusta CCNP1324]